MDVSNLTDTQKELYNKLRNNFESEQQFQTWLSLPNKMFRNKTPMDALLSGSFEYFDRYFGSTYVI